MESDIINKYFKNISVFKAVIYIIGGIIIWLLGDFFSSLFLDFIFSAIITSELPSYVYIIIRSVCGIGVTYYLLSLYIKKAFNAKMADFRISKINIKPIYILCAFVLPLFVIFCLMSTGGTFIDNEKSSGVVVSSVLIAFFYALNAGILEEMIFRGYIMKIIECKWNKKIAILVPSLFFALLHVPKMTEFSLSSLLLLLCAGTSVGAMFSVVTYGNKSIWGSAFIHTIWNMVIIGGILEISTIHNTNSVFSFILSSKNSFITGGSFGVESSIFAIIGYIIVILLSLRILKKEKNSI